MSTVDLIWYGFNVGLNSFRGGGRPPEAEEPLLEHLNRTIDLPYVISMSTVEIR